MVSGILIAMAVVGAVGLFIGLFLGIAGIKFKVEVDEREEAVLSALPIMSIMESPTVRCFPLSQTEVRNPVIMVVPVSVTA